MKEIIVDTDILSYYLFKNYPTLSKKFGDYIDKVGYINIARPTVFEIESGLRAKNAFSQLKKFEKFLDKQRVVELTQRSAHLSAKMYASLRKKGLHSGVNDLYIAGIALENDLIICTNNEKDYKNIAEIEIINWLEQRLEDT